MGKPKAVTAASEPGNGIRVEYVRSTGVLRITGWHSPNSQAVTVDWPVVQLVQELGIAPAELAPPCPYLVFGGSGVAGGSKDLVGAYRSEEAARVAFVKLRQGRIGGWGELVILEDTKFRSLAWFGQREPSPPQPRKRWRST